MSIRKQNQYQDHGDDSYFVSMTDIMVGLLFIFILIIMYFAFQLKVQAESHHDNYAQAATIHRTKILNKIKRHLEKNGVLNVEIDIEHGILRLPEGVLFDSGVADIPKGGDADKISEKLAMAFHEVLRCSVFSNNERPLDLSTDCIADNRDKIFIESVLIEGHTDNVPVGNQGLRADPKINSNLRLSARRATNTYVNLTGYEPALKEFRSPQNNALFAVSAYGATRPTASNTNEINKSNNRRIDIRLLMFVPVQSVALFGYKKRLSDFYETP